VKRLHIGDPLDAGNFTGPVIHRAAVSDSPRPSLRSQGREETSTRISDAAVALAALPHGAAGTTPSTSS
jgi:hypothetical protein